MLQDFRSARFWAADLIEQAMYPGARAIDATMGNGHDTCWLCRLAGSNGYVYAFDIQPDALIRTLARLKTEGLDNRACLICKGHEHMAEFVQEPVDAIVFNLGWLPGTEHAITTKVDTTMLAVKAALRLLKPGGLMTICVYPGHEEGEARDGSSETVGIRA